MKRSLVLALFVVAACQGKEPPSDSKSNSASAERRRKVYAAMNDAQQRAERALDDAGKALEDLKRNAKAAIAEMGTQVQDVGKTLQSASQGALEPLGELQKHADDLAAKADSALGILKGQSPPSVTARPAATARPLEVPSF